MVSAGSRSGPSAVTSTALFCLRKEALSAIIAKSILDLTEQAAINCIQMVLFSTFVVQCSAGFMQKSFLRVKGLIL